MEPRAAKEALRIAYTDITAVVESLDEDDFYKPTGAARWAVMDLLFHMHLDARRLLVGLATRSDHEPDRDFVTYWRGWSADDPDSIAHARAVRIMASAFRSPLSIVNEWKIASGAAVRAAAAAPDRRISTQGHVLELGDFLATIVVEAAIHHLDLVAYLDGPPGPADAPLAIVRRTLDGLLEASPPGDWDDATYALKATGRAPLTREDRAALGHLAKRFPLFS
jgi:hypothetical protein